MRFILETERLILREFATSDLEPLSKILSDPVTMQFYPAPLNRDQVAEWITRNQNRYREIGYGLWAMLLKITGELIGDCGLTRQTVDGAAEIEIGYHVRRDLWGRGYAPEAAVAARDWGFKTLQGRNAAMENYLVARFGALDHANRARAERKGRAQARPEVMRYAV